MPADSHSPGQMMHSRTRTIGLVADPGVPEATARKVADDLAEGLSQRFQEQWRAEVSREMLPLSPDGTIQLVEHAPQFRHRHGWDVFIYFSDLPRYVDDEPMLAEVSAEERAALIAVPVLGGVRLEARARDLVQALTRVIANEETSNADSVAAALDTAHLAAQPADGPSDLVRVVRKGRFGRARTLGGMVRSNRPGRLLSALTACIAAAVAAGAFGIFYGTLAPVADALSLWRLVLISLLVIAVLTTWLIIRNNLWNFEKGHDEIWRQGLDNASTVITVGLSVILLYIGLGIAMLTLAVAVLAPSYLQSELLRPVHALDYLKLAWLSAAMGAMAGALGANFDHEDAIRQATFNLRYHERRKLFDTYEEQEQDQE